jgi:Rps23 Pro-64 3,4-dihydroxylase Tpa1-like proline 4-hydroxylase
MLNKENIILFNNLYESYSQEIPFPHCIIDDFLEDKIANTISDLFSKEKFIGINHFNEKKKWTDGLNVSPDFVNLFNYLNSTEVISQLETITGITGLIPDKEMQSGGAHSSTKGGYLNIHADFTSHPYNKNWRRRINLLIYFSKDWEEAWGGQLELWDKEMRKCCIKIIPKFNRAVIFNTNETSYHGHPEPTNCPEGIQRKSVAMYYYTLSDGPHIATNYKNRPQDSFFKAVGIYLDKTLISIYHWLKGVFGISDSIVTKIKNFWRR